MRCMYCDQPAIDGVIKHPSTCPEVKDFVADQRVEKINHPAHYGGDTTYEAIKVIEAWGLGFCLGNAVKYISRIGKKPGAMAIDDLRKAKWYLDREIKNLEHREAEGA